MVGLIDVMDELRGRLTEGSSDLDVISIVGMPGVGKTTLANKLYFDQSVVSHFDIRAQCCVSQEYTRKDLLIAILGDIIGETSKLDNEAGDVLADKLRKHLFGMRYLILIDDIWKTSAWDGLRLCFHDASNGSRIILTTRHYDVASHAIHVSHPLVLRLLSSDEAGGCYRIRYSIQKVAPLVLRDVGKSIAQKCGGLLLPIVLVGGILARMEKEKYCLEQVETNLGPHIQVHSEHTIDLSYQNLPHHLRTCFLYFGVFSEDKEIQVSKLTWLRISEGFVKAHMEKMLENVAKDYLENLIGRNLLMVAKRSSDGQVKACHIHDLLRESQVGELLRKDKMMVKLRHLHIYDQAFFTLDNEQEFPESPSKMAYLQTLSSACFSCVKNADKVLAKMPNLRKLRCEVSKFDGSFPAFNNLTMLKISSGPTLTSVNQFKLPSSLKKLTLSNFRMNLNEVTTLSNLELLNLLGVTISSNIWKVNDEQFDKLKFLKLENPSFSEWDVSDDAFPCLEHLVLKRCRYLKVIPSCFGYMPSLKSIEVKSCKESVAESSRKCKLMRWDILFSRSSSTSRQGNHNSLTSNWLSESSTLNMTEMNPISSSSKAPNPEKAQEPSSSGTVEAANAKNARLMADNEKLR
ncbi:hypothetical protein RND71_002924 [Anisodus tanguticus]|uniref:NB-ARC domain-containing protein n=1 Tax=Anisodus tanguticus TaxID=243964 RepID=A0AAE1VN66_9SOLA|nr:hypothetical protein RND71_002924 [Anisodus tanguticus]